MIPPWRALRVWLGQPPARRRLMLSAWVRLALTVARLRTQPQRAVREAVGRRVPPDGDGAGRDRDGDRPTPDEVARAVEGASLAVPGARKCLPQSLACQDLLHRWGYEATLFIGAAKPEDDGGAADGGQGTDGAAEPGAPRLEAHAWVEHDGRPVIGDHEGYERFRPLHLPRKR